jgi:putative membrane protein
MVKNMWHPLHWGCGWGMGFWWPMGWPMLTLSILTIAIVMAIIVVGIWLASKTLRTPPSSKNDKALETLRDRYAKGEITAEEYRRMRRELLES